MTSHMSSSALRAIPYSFLKLDQDYIQSLLPFVATGWIG